MYKYIYNDIYILLKFYCNTVVLYNMYTIQK